MDSILDRYSVDTPDDGEAPAVGSVELEASSDPDRESGMRAELDVVPSDLPAETGDGIRIRLHDPARQSLNPRTDSVRLGSVLLRICLESLASNNARSAVREGCRLREKLLGQEPPEELRERIDDIDRSGTIPRVPTEATEADIGRSLWSYGTVEATPDRESATPVAVLQWLVPLDDIDLDVTASRDGTHNRTWFRIEAPCGFTLRLMGWRTLGTLACGLAAFLPHEVLQEVVVHFAQGWPDGDELRELLA